jgi:hypothetical protein
MDKFTTAASGTVGEFSRSHHFSHAPCFSLFFLGRPTLTFNVVRAFFIVQYNVTKEGWHSRDKVLLTCVMCA